MRRYPLRWLSDEQRQSLSLAIKHALPPAYNFEIDKTLQRLSDEHARRICLQFPEGLMVWAVSIAQIIEEFGDQVEHCIIIGDVTYGACCIDDVKARHLMNSDYLIHYAHSCLIPLDNLLVKCLYVFVEIDLDPVRLTDILIKAFPKKIEDATATVNNEPGRRRKMVIMSTIQFSKCAHACARILREKEWAGDEVIIPQEPPLSAGETLGCTSVKMSPDTDVCIFISDGRFHIESAMIQNPHVKFYRYDPFLKQLFTESYDLPRMLERRSREIQRALRATTYIIILSTLGRQGCPELVEHLKNLIYEKRSGEEIEVTILLMAELNPTILEDMAGDEPNVCFVNVGCPRLSIDWGDEYKVNVVNSFELVRAMRFGDKPLTSYTMDYFSSEGGEWSNGPYRMKRQVPSNIQERWAARKAALLQAAQAKN